MEDNSEDFLEVYDINDILHEPNTESDPLEDLLKRFDLMVVMPYLKGKLQLIIIKFIFFRLCVIQNVANIKIFLLFLSF